jgi:ABC transporter family protein/SH3 domain-containing protein
VWKRFLNSLMLLILLSIGIVQAQESSQAPAPVQFVGIISGNAIRSSELSNVGDDGISRLATILEGLGANVQTIAPDEAIPAEIELIILISPRRALSPKQTTILWQFLEDGGNLLLALDPFDHAGSRNERASKGGITGLIADEYGLNIVDNFLIEPWFGIAPLTDVITSWSDVQAEDLQLHAITQPLITYDLPLRYWGGRQILVQSLTGTSNTNALIYTESAYGESTRLDYESGELDQLELNIGEDAQGRILLGGIATHYQTGSRVALFGDGEMFQNIFGLTQSTVNDDIPIFLGNYIFTQRLLAWLMAIPELDFPTLPEGITWLSLDGNLSEWEEAVPNAQTVSINSVNVQNVNVFHNNQFMYLGIETTFANNDELQIEIRGSSRTEAFAIRLAQGNVNNIMGDDEGVRIGDAEYVFSEQLEARIPLRVVGLNPSITQICFIDADGDSNCIDGQITSSLVDSVESLSVRFPNQASAFLANDGNLRAQPSESAAIITVLSGREQFAIMGQDESGEWVYLINGRYEGWVASLLVLANTDISKLPIIDVQN